MADAGGTPGSEVDSEALGLVLKALGNPVRIDLLKALQQPRMLSEIRLHPRRKDGHHQPDRLMSRVTVKEHLTQLLDIGVVQHRSGIRDGRTVDLYTVNHRQLFAVTEQLRELAHLRPEAFTVGETTQVGDDVDPLEQATGPRLVLASGIPRGRVFRLSAETTTQDRWTIGRRLDAEVCLDYDPFVSTETATVRRDDGTWAIEAAPSTRNPVGVNGRVLEPETRAPLTDGDLIEVGRSLLVFRSA